MGNVRHGGVYQESVPRVYQESGGVAGEIAPVSGGRGLATRKRPKRCQKQGNGLPPSVTFMRSPPERLQATILMRLVEEMNLTVEDLGIQVEGKRVTVTGTADSQETH
jgi:hypothetical protein